MKIKKIEQKLLASNGNDDELLVDDDQEFTNILNDLDNQKYHEYEDKMRTSLNNIKKKHLLQDSIEKLLHKDDIQQ